MRPLPLPRSLLPESSAGSGASSCIGFGSSAGRHACHHLLALMSARGSPAFRSAEYDVLKQHHEEPEREASRCLVRTAVAIGIAIAGSPENDGHLSPWQETVGRRRGKGPRVGAELPSLASLPKVGATCALEALVHAMPISPSFAAIKVR